MIALITTCDPSRLSLLRPFVNHYRACGVESFYINLHFDVAYALEEHELLAQRASAILGELGLALHSVYSGPHDVAVLRRHHDRIQSQIASSSPWIVWADIDELHEFSDDLSKLTGYMEGNGLDYIEGRLIDRMARDGFPELRSDVSVWRQFPLGTDITRAVMRGWIEKIMLSRCAVAIAPGHHRLAPGTSAQRLPGIYSVHHFKWDASVVARLKRRLEEDWKQRCPWWTESERALKWIEAGAHETFADLSVYDFEDDREPGDGGPLSANPRYLRNQVRGPAAESAARYA